MGAAFEHFAGKVRGAADAGRAVAQLSRIGLRVIDELFERVRRHRRMDDKGVRADRNIDDRREILRDVIGRGLVHRNGERKTARRIE